MQIKGEQSINKLILLFIFDKMENALTENTLLDMCCTTNNWIAYMDCRPLLSDLIESSFVYKIDTAAEPLYAITAEGRQCLANFFIRIPISTREDINSFIKENRIKYRRKQECRADYYKNSDGTYTINLKIIEHTQNVLELKFNVPDRNTAKQIFRQWEEKAGDLFAAIYDKLVD